MTSPESSPYTLGLDRPQATLELAGGKGVSLARMAAAGLPVPRGFHISTNAYCRFGNHLGEAILTAAALARVDNPATLDNTEYSKNTEPGELLLNGDLLCSSAIAAIDPPLVRAGRNRRYSKGPGSRVEISVPWRPSGLKR